MEANLGGCPAEHLSQREAASCEELFKILLSKAARSDGETRDRRAEGETGRMKKDQEGGGLEGGCVSRGWGVGAKKNNEKISGGGSHTGWRRQRKH